jgi:hypothetical protein
MSRNPLDVGNQSPIRFTPLGAAAAREAWLTTCWSCKDEDAVDREDGLGLCPACRVEFRRAQEAAA